MDLAMGLTSGNANGTLATPSDYDDDWALALITDQRDVDIAGVVVTMGNGPLGPEMSVAQQTLDRLDVDVPLIAGAATWLPVVATLDSSGADLSATCVNDGVEFMANELRETEDLTIIATGPLTDVACTSPRSSPSSAAPRMDSPTPANRCGTSTTQWIPGRCR
jgi:pyrimidine-specific ribonucleoside hydrolase